MPKSSAGFDRGQEMDDTVRTTRTIKVGVAVNALRRREGDYVDQCCRHMQQ